MHRATKFSEQLWGGRSPNGELVLGKLVVSVSTVFRQVEGQGLRSGNSAIPRAL
jgi:hypothetical protein